VLHPSNHDRGRDPQPRGEPRNFCDRQASELPLVLLGDQQPHREPIGLLLERDPDRFRDRILQRSAELANERRAEEGLAPLPKTTPHSLRRTWAMLAAQAGRDPHWISDQIGHTSAAFTLQVYQQTRHRRLAADERQAVWELMRFDDEPAKSPFVASRQ
jgi:integrase